MCRGEVKSFRVQDVEVWIATFLHHHCAVKLTISGDEVNEIEILDHMLTMYTMTCRYLRVATLSISGPGYLLDCRSISSRRFEAESFKALCVSHPVYQVS